MAESPRTIFRYSSGVVLEITETPISDPLLSKLEGSLNPVLSNKLFRVL